MKCEKCGRELTAIELVMETFDGGNIITKGMSYAEMDGYNAGIDEVWNALQNLPVADAVPVVRCKDCQFWQRHTQVNRDYGKCERFGTVTTRCNDFCSLGAKKSEE